MNIGMTQRLQPKEHQKVLDRMMEIDATWDGGRPYLARATLYALLPKVMGKGLEKNEEFFEKAIEAGPNWLHSRLARAKYLRTGLPAYFECATEDNVRFYQSHNFTVIKELFLGRNAPKLWCMTYEPVASLPSRQS